MWKSGRNYVSLSDGWGKASLMIAIKKIPVSVFGLCQNVGYECTECFCGWRRSFLILKHKVFLTK